MIWVLSIISAEAESEDNSGVCDATLRTITRIVVVMIDIFSWVVIGTLLACSKNDQNDQNLNYFNQ